MILHTIDIEGWYEVVDKAYKEGIITAREVYDNEVPDEVYKALEKLRITLKEDDYTWN